MMMSSQSTVFISFQNGLGNEELIAELMGEDRVLGGLTAQGANIEVSRVIRVKVKVKIIMILMSGSGPHPGPHRPDHLDRRDGGPGESEGEPAV